MAYAFLPNICYGCFWLTLFNVAQIVSLGYLRSKRAFMWEKKLTARPKPRADNSAHKFSDCLVLTKLTDLFGEAKCLYGETLAQLRVILLARLVPSRYLSIFWGERRLGIRLRRAVFQRTFLEIAVNGVWFQGFNAKVVIFNVKVFTLWL